LESDPATRTPIADKSFEHAHSVLEFSSARTPKMDLLPNAPGRIQYCDLDVWRFTR